jgi:hypothetical protein
MDAASSNPGGASVKRRGSSVSENQFEHDRTTLGWRVAMGLYLENRTTASKIIAWADPFRASVPSGTRR